MRVVGAYITFNWWDAETVVLRDCAKAALTAVGNDVCENVPVVVEPVAHRLALSALLHIERHHLLLLWSWSWH